MLQRLSLSALLLVAIAALALPAQAQKESDVAETIDKFKESDPGIKTWFDTAHGYAVFPSVGKGGIGLGGARGKGLVYEQGAIVGEVTMSQVTVGFQLGGQTFSQVIFFKDNTAFDDFIRGNFEFDAGVSAVALKSGVSKDLAYSKGIAVITATKAGLMYEASLGGQKFKYEAN